VKRGVKLSKVEQSVVLFYIFFDQQIGICYHLLMQYDLITIGVGPAGYTAGIYASRYKMKNLVIGEIIGGVASEAHLIWNYPGFDEISGVDLMMKFRDQAKKIGTEEILDRVMKVEKTADGFKVETGRSGTFESKYLLLAIGSKRRKLGLPREEEYLGKGVSYCATCDGFLYKEKTVAVVGGADSAVMAAVHLAAIASKVYIIYRGDKLRAEPMWADQALNNPKIEIIYNSNIIELQGDGKLAGVKLDKDNKEVALDGLFIEIGFDPNLSIPEQLGVKTDERGYIETNDEQKTNVAGVYAAGDCTNGSSGFKQIVVATAHGAVAVKNIFFELQKAK